MSRRRHTDKEKARIIREFKNHHGSTAEFCRQHLLGQAMEEAVRDHGLAAQVMPTAGGTHGDARYEEIQRAGRKQRGELHAAQPSRPDSRYGTISCLIRGVF